ncbi:hypothetical protein AGMMS49983_11470 [Clostridia bacterium]|nr:hypothetical protein AGMMS49983_11470 [Clostridia bacterium]
MCTIILLAALAVSPPSAQAGEQVTVRPVVAGGAPDDQSGLWIPGQARDDKDGAGEDNGGGYLSKEEVVYASLAADGSAKEAYIVNILSVDKAGPIEDHGYYDSIKNLTTEEPITYSNGIVTANVPSGDFYYQGNIEKPELPWSFEITYTLDGKKIDPASLGGQSGHLDIEISARANKTASQAWSHPGWRDNCMIQTQVTLDTALCRNIQAEGGMIANAGANKMITFTTLPGKDADIQVSADVTYFSMPGIQFSAVPMRMSIGDVDTSEMTEQLDELTDAIASLDNGVAEMRDGVRKLHDGAASYTNGAHTFQNGIAQAAAAGTDLKAGSQSIEDGLAALAGGLSQTATGVSALPGTIAQQLAPAVAGGVTQGISPPLAQGLAQQLQANGLLVGFGPDPNNAYGIAAAEALISGVLSDEQYGLKPVLSAALVPALDGGLTQAFSGNGTPENPGLIGGLNGISGGLSALSGQYAAFDDGLGAYTAGVSQISAGAGQLTSGAAEIESGTLEFQTGIQKLKNGTAEMRSETAGMGDQVQEKIDEMMAEYDKSGYVPLSFAFPYDNYQIHAIQFVITSAAIEEPGMPAAEGTAAVKESILDRLLALFGIQD